MCRPAIIIAVLSCFVWSASFAQERSGEIVDRDWGLRFTPPEGWRPVESMEGYVFVEPAQQGFLALIPHEARTLEALRAEAIKGIEDEYGTRLRLTGSIETFRDDGLAADFAGWLEGSPAKARVIGLISPNGRGATVLVAAAPELFTGDHADLVEKVAGSIVFAAAPDATSSAEDSTPTDPAGTEEKEWEEFLTGCRLYISNSYNSGDGGGYIDETTIDLCPGYFTFSDKSMTVFNEIDPVSGDAPYLHENRRGAGRWTVIRRDGGSVLQLLFHDGAEKSFRLGWEDGKTYLDSTRWLRACDPTVSVGPRCD